VVRARPEDVLWLAHRFVADWNRAHPDASRELTGDGERVLMQQRWPGNVRELRNTIERACLLSHERWIDTAQLAIQDGAIAEPVAVAEPAPDLQRLEQFLKEQERGYIQRALAHHAWQIGQTAEALGISRQSPVGADGGWASS